jgi:methyl-accepting chemotaxis protein
MSLAQKVYMPVDGNQHAVYLKDGQVIVDLPAYDETGQVFGRQIFIQDESVFTQSLVEARNQAWLTLLSVLLGIVVLALILTLMIKRMVIRPLQGLSQTMLTIEQSGDFSRRVLVHSDDEVGQTAKAMNQHLEQVSRAIKQANQSIGAMAKGDLNQRIEGRFVGDLLQLQQG